jgi:hypothetical protein
MSLSDPRFRQIFAGSKVAEVGLVLLLLSPLLLVILLIREAPSERELVARSGVVEHLEQISAASKTGANLRIHVNDRGQPRQFLAKFCHNFVGSIGVGDDLTAWLDPAERESWRIERGSEVLCSYEAAVETLALGNRNVKVISLFLATGGGALILCGAVSARPRRVHRPVKTDPPPPPDNDRSSDRLRCSFCSKTQDKVRKLIAGPAVYICDECVELCNDIRGEEWEGERDADANNPRRQFRARSSISLLHASFAVCPSCLSTS